MLVTTDWESIDPFPSQSCEPASVTLISIIIANCEAIKFYAVRNARQHPGSLTQATSHPRAWVSNASTFCSDRSAEAIRVSSDTKLASIGHSIPLCASATWEILELRAHRLADGNVAARAEHAASNWAIGGAKQSVSFYSPCSSIRQFKGTQVVFNWSLLS